MSFSAALNNFETGTYTVTRGSAGAVVDYKFVPGVTSTFSIDAGVQPSTPKDLQVLPEALWTTELRVVYTETELRTLTDGIPADTIAIDGKTYQVVRVEHFAVLSNHYRAIVSRTELPA